MLTGALTCAFVFPPECERPRICIQLPPNAPPAVSRGYHERGPGLRGTSSGTTSLAVVSSSPQGHVTTTSTPVLGAAADDRGSGRSVVTVAFLPVARVGVVNVGKGVGSLVACAVTGVSATAARARALTITAVRTGLPFP